MSILFKMQINTLYLLSTLLCLTACGMSRESSYYEANKSTTDSASVNLPYSQRLVKFGYFSFDFDQLHVEHLTWRGRIEPLIECSSDNFLCVKTNNISFVFPRSCLTASRLRIADRWTYSGITMEVLDVRTDFLPLHQSDANGIYFYNIDQPDNVFRFQFRGANHQFGVIDTIFTDTRERLSISGQLPFRDLARSRTLSSDQIEIPSSARFSGIHSLIETLPADPAITCRT